MPLFNDKEYQEILRARARLEKSKVKDYYPDPRDYGYIESDEPTTPRSIFELDRASQEKIQQLKCEILYLDKQIKELRVKKEEEEITIEC